MSISEKMVEGIINGVVSLAEGIGLKKPSPSFREALLNYTRIVGVEEREDVEKGYIVAVVGFHSLLSATPELRELRAKDVSVSLWCYCCPKEPWDTCKETAENIIKNRSALFQLLPERLKNILKAQKIADELGLK